MVSPRFFILIALCALLAHPIVLKGQNSWEYKGGLDLSAQVPIGSFTPSASLPHPDVPLSYTPVDLAWRPQLFIGADVKVDTSLRLGASVLFTSTHLAYTASEQTVIATPNGGLRSATIGHSLQVNTAAVGIRPYGRWLFTPWLTVEVGASLQIPMTATYQQTMRFTDPPNLTFVNGSLEQVTGNGTLPQASSVVAGLDAGVEGLLPITEQWWLTPGVYVGTNLSSWNSTMAMRTLNIVPSVGVRYRPEATVSLTNDTTLIRDTVVILSGRVQADSTELLQRLVEEFRGTDTVRIVITEHYRTYVPKPPSVLRASLRLLFETDDGKLSSDARLRVSTIRRTRIVPILPLVVFDDSIATIPERYVSLDKQTAMGWTVDKALTGKAHWQYNILNVAGARLRGAGNGSVQIIAYDDGTAPGKVLATTRAQNVKSYLTTVFGIAEQRLKVEVKNGQRSQQPWVFVVDTMRKVLAPIQATDTITESLLPKVRISPDVVSEVGVRSWAVTMSQGDSLLHSIEGKGAVPATLIWDMNENIKPEQAFVAPIAVQLGVADADGKKAISDPGLITLAEVSTTDRSTQHRTRTEVLRWIGADYLHTPDLDLFGTTPSFDHIDVYPSNSRRSDFFVVNAPTTVHPVGAKAWFREGLAPQELLLFDHVELYIKNSW